MTTTEKALRDAREALKLAREALLPLARADRGSILYPYSLLAVNAVKACDAELDAALAHQATAEPVAWCELTPNGQIAYFDGKPMVMPGPVGNDCHPHPLYTHAARRESEDTRDAVALLTVAAPDDPIWRGMNFIGLTEYGRTLPAGKYELFTRARTIGTDSQEESK
jgi:hypothetical protein